MGAYFKREHNLASTLLELAASSAVCAWAVGSLAQFGNGPKTSRVRSGFSQSKDVQPRSATPDKSRLLAVGEKR